MRKPKRIATRSSGALPIKSVTSELQHVHEDERVYMLDALQEEFRKRGYEPYSRQRIWQLEQMGAFPARIRLGLEKYSRIGWLRREVNEWFRTRLKSRPENRWRMPSELEDTL